MALRWYTIVVDSHDPARLSRWWAETLGWVIVYEADDEVVVVPPGTSIDPVKSLDDWLAEGQGLVFVPVPEDKTVKNRLHIDLAPHSSQDREAEIKALLERGATEVEVGQSDADKGAVTWTVLADPEGNEFCVLSTRDR
ncbi:hypothetical protein FB459_1720 [Yimella lutea]|uniref:Glyoxalase-like domain-containing protein n=1 Tax=Yimella lutea TaxID=587872 RepID=A0A542EG05_9MICO|nr:VOC family protein [Yimella lutea]TQJ14272.1 hypothetical protein FB459_1720 [Yimella lutea]